MPVFLEDYLREELRQRRRAWSRPTPGGVERARAWSKRLDASLAIIDKRRERANESEVMHLIGDVKGKDCIIVDDLVDTAGTLCNAARALQGPGRQARRRPARPTRSSPGPAMQRIVDSPLAEVVFTNSIPLSPEAAAVGQDQADLDCPALGRGDPPNPQQRLGELALRLETFWRPLMS